MVHSSVSVCGTLRTKKPIDLRSSCGASANGSTSVQLAHDFTRTSCSARGRLTCTMNDGFSHAASKTITSRRRIGYRVRTMSRAAPFAAALLLAACSTTLDATAYDQTCAQDGDCAVVTDGNACQVCTCPTTAVNVADAQRFRDDFQRLKGYCGPMSPVACGPCRQAQPTCDAGTCALREL